LQDYQSVFDRLDLLFVLQAPDFDAVARWRFEQEEHLAARRASAGQSSGHAIMDRQQIAQFVQYFQRLTEHGLKVLPALADRVWLLNADRSIDGIWRGSQ
jgi:D-glycerate 3-kinase